MGYNVTMQGVSCNIPLQHQYTYAVKFCYIYCIIVNVYDVIRVISQLTVHVCDQLLQYFWSRIPVQFAGLFKVRCMSKMIAVVNITSAFRREIVIIMVRFTIPIHKNR
jgi:hypothetical protein